MRRAEPRTETNPVSGRDGATDRNSSGNRTNWVRLRELSKLERELVANAEKAVLKAVVTQSGVRVGAAVQTRNGIYEGCNVESVISGLGICAERNAINHAIIRRGQTPILKVAVAWEKDSPIRPCGACLQYIYEFSVAEARSRNPKIIMLSVGSDWVEVSRLRELLPEAYHE